MKTERRHEIYVNALEHYKQVVIDHEKTGQEDYWLTGLCYSIEETTNYNEPNAYTCMEKYPEIPEIAKHLPEGKSLNGNGYWYPLGETAIRIMILEEAINETSK